MQSIGFDLQCIYISNKEITWNKEKEELLLKSRNIDLNKVSMLIKEHKYLVGPVPNQAEHPGQNMFIVKLDDYVVCAPFVINEDSIFIKTAFPSRMFQKQCKDLL